MCACVRACVCVCAAIHSVVHMFMGCGVSVTLNVYDYILSVLCSQKKILIYVLCM